MTDEEKQLLQVKHQLEEAQVRDRVKERKTRTRRLIQEGAILEKVVPQVIKMELMQIEDFLFQQVKRMIKMMGRSEKPGRPLF